ncbi:nucleotidyltransferase family protein [Peptoniphilus sp. oral taxon 386]|uniref:tRNA(Met) cytidine acetate ligase n=1 Tax=Peptoniphilus sp. oral taxon 386 TaxID=652713 RepID=UPI0002F3C8BC|nr:nucleotidyltransferase family protein [Peptoniphilus sp. oral taxon 386]
MKTAAIIAEYNPFHNGHLYQLKKIKEKNLNAVIIMSSSFTQRGTPAIIDKFARTKIALTYGADLVLELPVIFSTSNAEIFSKGAINILESLDSIDYLYFGAEDSLENLLKINEKIELNKKNSEEKLKNYLSAGKSYLEARELSYDFLDDTEIEILKKSNNILGIEYLKALKHINSYIQPAVIQRKNTCHNSDLIIDNFTSASSIRKLIENKNLNSIENLVPKKSFDEIKNSSYNFQDRYFEIFKFLVLSQKINYENYVDYENGLENRFMKYLSNKNIYDFIESVSSKRYTKSRISRLITQIILDIKKDFIFEALNANYIRILGIGKNGTEILKVLKDKNIFFIDKFAKINSLNKNSTIKQIAEKEIFATNMYNMMINKNFMEDYLKSPIII